MSLPPGPPQRLSLLAIAMIAAIMLLAQACLPDLDISGKEGCYSDVDCISGARCDGATPSLPGRCIADGAATNNDPDRCVFVDRDNDGVSSGEGCTPFDCDDANPSRAPGLLETCDTLDNDCDGFIDEGVRGACGTCNPLATEVCNGRDEDCDGVIDDGFLNRCGTCGTLPEEFCDGVDNDCDDLVDEGLSGCGCTGEATQACPPQDITSGACAQGTQACVGGRWGTCEGAQFACEGVVERCDLADNNGEGRIDENYNTRTDAENCGACGVVCGSFQSAPECVEFQCQLNCREGWHDADGDSNNGCEYPCVPTSSIDICEDGLDNDCDGSIDTRCAKLALGGRYAFFVLYGVSEPERGISTALIQGVLDIPAPFTGQATLGELVIVRSGGRAPEERAGVSRRRVTFLEDHTVELAPESGEADAVGSVFRGYVSNDPGRSLILFNEFSSEGSPLGTLAVAVRLPDPAVETPSAALRGPMTGVQLLPNALIGEGSSPAASVFSLSLNADPNGITGHVLARNTSLGANTYTLSQAPRVNASLSRSGGFTSSVEGNGVSLRWEGQQALQQELAIAGVTDRGQRTPGLVALATRRDDGGLEQLEGRWFLAGLRVVAPATPNDPLSYRSVRRTFRAERDPEAPNRRRLFLITEEGESLWGSAATTLDLVGRSLLIDTVEQNGNKALDLRGFVLPSGLGMLLWEQGETAYDAPASSVFFAIQLP